MTMLAAREELAGNFRSELMPAVSEAVRVGALDSSPSQYYSRL